MDGKACQQDFVLRIVDGAAPLCYNLRMDTCREMTELSRKFGVRAEFYSEKFYPAFRAAAAKKKLLIVSDANTAKYAVPFLDRIRACGSEAFALVLSESEPVADERTCEEVADAGERADYILAVGSGTLNDIAKYVSYRQGKECGVLATAASMDGFTSGVVPLIKNGQKITEGAHVVSDILIDFDILCSAPKIMTGAGVGDILAKHCSLADWKLAHVLKGEPYNENAASLMRSALAGCERSLGNIREGGRGGIADLMNALLVSGYAMVLAGNSRPASGAEHHMSHYLEMDFLKRGERIPLHGVKVGLGTIVSLCMYHRLSRLRHAFPGKEEAERIAAALPLPERAEEVLRAFGCPTRFSQIGVSEDTVRDMLFRCYKIRDRFTIMTLYHEQDLMRGAADELIGLYY